MKISGYLTIEKVTPDGVREKVSINNTILDTGHATIAGLIVADLSVGSRYDFIAIGLGSSTISGNQTILGSEYLRVATTGLLATSGATTNNTSRFVGSFSIDATKTVNEAGVFNDSVLDTGSILSRTTFADLSVISGDAINVDWKVSFE